MGKASQVATIMGAVIGLCTFVLLVVLEKQHISEWEMWDIFRRGATEDATILIAKLRNDKEGRYTEDLLQWVKQQGIQYYELGRSWKGDEDAEKREQALSRTQSLALVEGYVGSDGAVIRIWAKGGRTSEERNFGRGKDDPDNLVDSLEKIMVQGMRYEAWLGRARMGNDEEYEGLRERARQTRKQMKGEKRQEEVDFIIAYIENIRADKKGEGEAQKAAIGIYTRLLAQVQDETERIPLLVNLGIAEFREARREGSEKAAEAAIRRWNEAERIAEERGLIDEWATTRTFQTEAELLIREIRGNNERAITALKRQIETFEDTQGILSESTTLMVMTWLTKVDGVRNESHITEECFPRKGDRRATQNTTMHSTCLAVEEIQWTEEEYKTREARTNRWLGIARAAGDEITVTSLVGVRADLLRNRGLRENNPGLLITSFEGTHQYRTRAGIIDEGVAEGELVIGISQMVVLVELEASLALACADLEYMKKLTKEIRVSELWCRQGSIENCEARQEWRRNVIAALEYGSASWEMHKSGHGGQQMVLEDDTAEIWRHAAWVRDKGAELAYAESLCPNRPQGITENEEQRENSKINERTRAYQKIRRTSKCTLPRQLLTTAPSLPSDVGNIEEWRESIGEWINTNRRQFQEDIQTIKACEGEPW
ncbi:MAG: hypothetical protein OXE42_04280 [Gammaproteobacteria bacterium]|nr:hypothetical protein [Gammaproteobacteria bacterium]